MIAYHADNYCRGLMMDNVTMPSQLLILLYVGSPNPISEANKELLL
jgi:hypothetical protein